MFEWDDKIETLKGKTLLTCEQRDGEIHFRDDTGQKYSLAYEPD